MIELLVVMLWAATIALAGYGLTLTALNRPADDTVRLGVKVVVGLLVVQALLAGLQLVQGVRLAEPTEVIIYLVVAICVLPFVTQFAMAEPNRWGGAIIAAGAIATGVAVWRLQVLWVPLA